MQSLFKVLPPRRSRRECPDCAIAMASYLCGKVTVESCLQCRGVWFDQRELGDFRAGLESFNLEDLNLPPSDPDDAKKFAVNFCPICRRQLDRGQYAYNSRVFVDRCEKCHGLWLPGTQVTAFISLVRISKSIAQDVKDLGREQAKLREENEHFELLTGATRKPLSTGKRITMFANARGGAILPLFVEGLPAGTPWTNIVLMTVTALFHFLSDNEAARAALGLVPRNLWAQDAWIPLITAPFVHASAFHLLFNLFYLWLFGGAVSLRIGPAKYLTLYLFASITSGLAYAAMNASSTLPAIGASGAISGVLGAFAVLFPRAPVHTLIFGVIHRLHIWYYVVVFIGANLLIGYQQSVYRRGNVGWEAHLGGLLAGVLIARLLRARVRR